MTDLQPGARVCAYLRDSGGRDQEISTEQQEQKIIEFCADQGLVLSRIFKDVARSGGSTAGRDGFLDMIDYLTDPKTPEQALVLWSYSRFAREYDTHQYYIAALRQAGKTVISLTDQVPDTLDGRIMESLIAWQHAKFRDTLSRDIRRGIRYMKEVYKAWSGPAPIGYKLEPFETTKRRDGTARINSRLVPDSETAPLVVRTFELRAEGATYLEIVKAIPQLGHKNKPMRIVNNAIYIGIYDHEGIYIDDYCRPLIDRATWEAAQAVNRERGKNMHPRRVRSDYILSGILNCAICDRPMNGHSSGRLKGGKYHYKYYRCTSKNSITPCDGKSIPKLELEDMVKEAVLGQLLHPDYISMVLEKVQRIESERGSKHDTEVDQLRRDLRALDPQIRNVVDGIRQVGMSSTLREELTRLEERKAAYQLRLSELEAASISQVEIPKVDDYVVNLHSKVKSADGYKLGDLYRGLGIRIWAKMVEGKIGMWMETNIMGVEGKI